MTINKGYDTSEQKDITVIAINIDYYEELKKKADFVDKMISNSANEIYKELEELKRKADELDEKETPYKPNILNFYNYGYCKCSSYVTKQEDKNYCSDCGQKLDWTKSEV